MERALVLNKYVAVRRRQAHARNERTERMIEYSNCNAKGNNEEPAARSKEDAAEPLGISFYLSRVDLRQWRRYSAICLCYGFRCTSRLFGSLRILLSFLYSFCVIIFFARFTAFYALFGLPVFICIYPRPVRISGQVMIDIENAK